VLISPHFLFLVEPEPEQAGVYALGGYPLASRLSYFLWATMPDEELFRLAADGSLTKPDVLRAQIKRMLQDPRAAAFAENFTTQWLGLKALGETVRPDPQRFPEFDAALADPAVRNRLLVAEPGQGLPARDAARRVVTEFARRAFRRPIADAEAEHAEMSVLHRDRRHALFENGERRVGDVAKRQLRQVAHRHPLRLRRERIRERLSQLALHLRRAIKRHRPAQVTRDWPQIVQAIHVIGMSVCVQDRVHDLHPGTQELQAQLRRRVDQDVPLVRGDEDGTAIAMISRISGAAHFAVAPDHGHADTGSGSEEGESSHELLVSQASRGP